MFCGECGTKNEKGAQFCEKCGAKLETEKSVKKTTKKTKQPMKKENKAVIILVSVVAVLLIALYCVGSSLTKPENIVKKYMDAIVKKDYSTLYDYMVDVKTGDTTFVSEEVFKSLFKDLKSSKIINYTVGKATYDVGKLTSSVSVSYTLEGDSSTKDETIKLKKSGNKVYLVFDNWILADSYTQASLAKNFEIKVPTNATLNYEGVNVDKKYIDKEKSSDNYDTYVLPQVFSASSKIKTTLESGIVIEEQYTPVGNSDTYTVRLSSSNVSESFKKKLIEQGKKDIKTIYDGAIANTPFASLSSNNFSSDLSSDYDDFLSSITSSSRKLTKFDLTKADYYSLSTTDEGYVRLGLKINYNYTVKYTSYFDDKEETKDSKSYDYVYLTYDVSGKTYKLCEISSLPTYFSIY